MFSFVLSEEPIRLSRVFAKASRSGKKAVPSREYLERQATIFLDLARSTKDPELAAALADSAAHYTSQAETIQTRDTSPRAPDVEM
jgi:hypothetical protein